MLQGSDDAELRALQIKAYGRGGGLTDADAARLRELESTRVEPAVAGPGGDPVDVPLSAEDSLLRHAEAPVADMAGGSPADEGADGPPPLAATGLRAVIRRHWKAAVAASATLLVIGLGTGWALFGQSGDAVALTSEQQQRRAELQAEGGFDPGSLRVIGQDEDALVWYATKDEGATICLTLDTADRSGDQCQPAADLDNGNGIGISASVTVPEADGEAPEQIWASAARAMNGDVVGIIQRWRSDQDAWLTQFQGEERERAEQLLEEGFEQFSFSVVGYFRDAPVWYGQRIEDDVVQDCLIVDAVKGIECRVAGQVQSSADGIRVSGGTGEDSAEPVDPWTVTLAYTPNGTPYLVVSGDAAIGEPAPAPTVEPGETLELGGEKQDPIQVDIPADDSDG